jgi:hypothetical protein
MLREVFESGRPLTYVRSAEEQRVARVLREVSLRLLAVRAHAGLDLEPHRGNASRRRRRPGRHARSPRARWTSSRRTKARHLPPQGLSRAAARISGDPPPPSRPLRELSRPAQVRRDQFPGALHSGGGRTQPLFLELRRPIWSSWSTFCATRSRPADGRGDASDGEVCCTNWRALSAGLTLDEARYALRRALAAGPRLDRNPCRPARRKAAAGQPQRRHRIHRRGHQARQIGGLETSRSGCWSAASCFKCATA